MAKRTVLAVSGSQRKKSFTEKMLDLCVEGMGDGVEVKKFYPHKMDIGSCTSCYSCWGKKNPGVCVQQDDFNLILEAYKTADYFLLAFPLYFFGFPATIKNMIDRFFIIIESTQRLSPRGYTDHPKRFDRHPKSVLISSCGFPEVENFDLVRQHFKKICTEAGWNWAGEILISAAGAANVPKLFNGKFELIRRAGKELAEEGAIHPETADAIASPAMEAADYREMCNASFESGFAAKARLLSIGAKHMKR